MPRQTSRGLAGWFLAPHGDRLSDDHAQLGEAEPRRHDAERSGGAEEPDRYELRPRRERDARGAAAKAAVPEPERGSLRKDRDKLSGFEQPPRLLQRGVVALTAPDWDCTERVEQAPQPGLPELGAGDEPHRAFRRERDQHRVDGRLVVRRQQIAAVARDVTRAFDLEAVEPTAEPGHEHAQATIERL